MRLPITRIKCISCLPLALRSQSGYRSRCRKQNMIIFICRPRRSVWVICCSNIKITYIYERKQNHAYIRRKSSSKEIKVGIVAARFNEFIVSKLVAGARDGLLRHDVKDEDIDLAWVPGAFEIPLIASKMAKAENMMQ